MGAASPTAFLHELHTVETRTQAAVLLSSAQKAALLTSSSQCKTFNLQFYKLYEDL